MIKRMFGFAAAPAVRDATPVKTRKTTRILALAGWIGRGVFIFGLLQFKVG
jgi:hypothetical protein